MVHDVTSVPLNLAPAVHQTVSSTLIRGTLPAAHRAMREARKHSVPTTTCSQHASSLPLRTAFTHPPPTAPQATRGAQTHFVITALPPYLPTYTQTLPPPISRLPPGHARGPEVLVSSHNVWSLRLPLRPC